MYKYLSTSTQVHKKHLSTYLSTNILEYSSSPFLMKHYQYLVNSVEMIYMS